MSAKRLLHQVRPLHVVSDIEGADAGLFLGGGDALVGEVDALSIQLDFVVLGEAFLLFLGFFQPFLGLFGALAGGFDFGLVAFGFVHVPLGGLDGALGSVYFFFDRSKRFVQLDHLAGDAIGLSIFGGVIVGSAGDDQRRAGFVDQNRINLVDDGKIEIALDLKIDALLHIVAEVIEAKFAVGAVGDVALVHLAADVTARFHFGLDEANRHPQVLKRGTNPIGIAANEVIVDCDDLTVHAFQHTQEAGEGGDEGLAFAGGHFGDLSLGQHQAADDLDIETAGAEGGAGFGVDLADGIVELGRYGNTLPGLTGLYDLLLDLVVKLASGAFQLVGVEVFFGIEDGADANVAVHRFADDGHGFVQDIR